MENLSEHLSPGILQLKICFQPGRPNNHLTRKYPYRLPISHSTIWIEYKSLRMRWVSFYEQKRVNFCERPSYQQKSSGTTRVALIGDSFVVGVVPREKNFVSGIQNMAVREGLNIEMLNMGISASGPNNYEALMSHDAVFMDADIVGVMLFIGNDIIESHPDFRTKVWLGTPRVFLRKPYLIGFSTEYLYVYRAFRTIFRLITEKTGKENKAAGATFSLKNYLAIEQQRAAIMKTGQNTFIRQSYEGAITALRQMAKTAKERNMKFFVILAPDELEVNQQLRNVWIKQYSIERSEFDFDLPQKILSEQLRKSDILFIDLLPFFKKKNLQTGLYSKAG